MRCKHTQSVWGVHFRAAGPLHPVLLGCTKMCLSPERVQKLIVSACFGTSPAGEW